MSSATLKHKAVSATLWSGVDAFARQGLRFCISLILARLLTPADYGTVGLLIVFTGLADVFVDSGFSSALIQRKEINDTDLSSVFYFNIFMALLMAAALYLAAPWIAAFYKMPVLRPLTWLLAANMVVGSFSNIQGMLLNKALNIRRLCIIGLISATGSGAVAILLAWKGYGVWSLGIQFLIASVLRVVLIWWHVSWRPRWVFSLKSIRALFKFSSFLLLSSLADTLFGRLNTLFIGKFYSASDLGQYSRADGLQQLPGDTLSGIISRVAFPLFSASHTDERLLRAGLKKAITLVMMLNLPIMVGMLVTASPLVRVLFGAQWLPCVPYVRILCLGGMLWPLHVLNLSVLKAQGHSNLFFRLEVIKKTLGILLLAAACPFGIAAIAWSTALGAIISFVINAYYSGRFLQYGTLRQTLDLLPCFTGALVMAACVWALSFLPIQTPIVMLAIQIGAGVIVYVLFCLIFELKAFAEAVAIAKSRLPFGARAAV